MDDLKKQLIERLKESKNVLVTVSKNPTVDQLSAAIGLAVALNRLDKHAAAVFSGEIPSTIQFLRPEETLQSTTDSLRDFIIALDKSKADKLRYKVEDDVVRIFITPYHTSISQEDLEFTQGDFNVDVVVALGVKTQEDLDDAVQAHGRILHDATVATLSVDVPSQLGLINIVDEQASSLSEMVLALVEGLGKQTLDTQVATSLLTGIVAMTDRFSNDRTTPKTMSASATLMGAGANQQLITNELEAPVQEIQQKEQPSDQVNDDGSLEIHHEAAVPDFPTEPTFPNEEPDEDEIHVDANGKLTVVGQDDENEESVDLPELPNQPEPPKIELKHERMLLDRPSPAETSGDNSGEAGGYMTTEDLINQQSAQNGQILSRGGPAATDQPTSPALGGSSYIVGGNETPSDPPESPEPQPTASEPVTPPAIPLPEPLSVQGGQAGQWQPSPTAATDYSGKTLAELEEEVARMQAPQSTVNVDPNAQFAPPAPVQPGIPQPESLEVAEPQSPNAPPPVPPPILPM